MIWARRQRNSYMTVTGRGDHTPSTWMSRKDQQSRTLHSFKAEHRFKTRAVRQSAWQCLILFTQKRAGGSISSFKWQKPRFMLIHTGPPAILNIRAKERAKDAAWGKTGREGGGGVEKLSETTFSWVLCRKTWRLVAKVQSNIARRFRGWSKSRSPIRGIKEGLHLKQVCYDQLLIPQKNLHPLALDV